MILVVSGFIFNIPVYRKKREKWPVLEADVENICPI